MFTHMEFHNGQPSRTRPAKHFAVVLGAKINETVYSKVNARAPKAASTKIEAKLNPMPDTGAITCIMGRQMLDQLNMNKSKMVKVTELLVAANGDLITLDGAVFLDLTIEGKTTTQMVYVSAHIKNMLLSKTACKGLGLVTKEIPNSTMQPGIAECTATEDDKDDGMGCDCPNRTEAPEPPTFDRNARATELEATI